MTLSDDKQNKNACIVWHVLIYQALHHHVNRLYLDPGTIIYDRKQMVETMTMGLGNCVGIHYAKLAPCKSTNDASESSYIFPRV